MRRIEGLYGFTCDGCKRVVVCFLREDKVMCSRCDATYSLRWLEKPVAGAIGGATKEKVA